MDVPSNAPTGYWLVEGQTYYLSLPHEPTTYQFQNVFREFSQVVQPLDSAVSLILDVTKLHITGGTWVNVLDANRELRKLAVDQAFVVGQSQHRLMKLMMLKLFEQVAREVIFHNTLDEVVGHAPSA
jgi:hypothetical protein